MIATRLRGLLANLALVAAALGVSFLVLELGVRLFVDLEEQAPIGVHDVDPGNRIRFLPESEHLYETAEFRYRVHHNRFGRRDVEWTAAQMADPKGLLFIGDSFIYGNGVADQNAIPTRLEAILSASGSEREVFNFGMPGTGPLAYERLLQDAFELGIRARTVVVGIFVGNDFYPSELQPPREEPTRADSRPAVQNPWPRSEMLRFLKLRVSQSPRLVGWILSAGAALGISVYDTAGSYIFLRDPTRKQRQIFDRILDTFGRMQQACSERGCVLRLVIFPNKIQVENTGDLTSGGLDAHMPNRRILAYCGERGIPCLDLLPVLSSEYERTGEPLFFRVDRHLNEAGTAIAAEAIGRFLREQEGNAARLAR